MKHVTGSSFLRRTYRVEFKTMVLDKDEVNACACHPVRSQYLIIVNTGLLKACYEFLTPRVTAYYKRHANEIADIDLQLFLRSVLGSSGLSVFWHEFAHIVRGHLAYKISLGELTDATISEAHEAARAGADEALAPPGIPWRMLELDADIYGAQFQLAQLAVVARANPSINITTFARCYAIGMRGLFEVLNGMGGWHDDAPGSTHPHPISRAYMAYSHAVARLDEMGFSKDQQKEIQNVGQSALLEFEVAELKMSVDLDVMQRFIETELEQWRKLESKLLPFQLKRHKL